MKINEAAKLTGITVRTLHYYDEIGLLHPSEITEAGYRLYDERALEALQQILFFRELDFPLQEIKEIMTSPGYNKREALMNHRELLLQKKNRLEKLIGLVEANIKGEKKMSFQEFSMKDIEESREKYAKEAKERWGGSDAYMESERKTASYDEAKWKQIQEESNRILKDFAQIRHLPADSEDAEKRVKDWQNHISTYYYKCTDEILTGLGLIYQADERFQKNMDGYGDGTAVFMAEAIAAYTKA